MTINEFITRKRCSYITETKPMVFKSAFDRGTVNNLKDFFCNRRSELIFAAPVVKEEKSVPPGAFSV